MRKSVLIGIIFLLSAVSAKSQNFDYGRYLTYGNVLIDNNQYTQIATLPQNFYNSVWAAGYLLASDSSGITLFEQNGTNFTPVLTRTLNSTLKAPIPLAGFTDTTGNPVFFAMSNDSIYRITPGTIDAMVSLNGYKPLAIIHFSDTTVYFLSYNLSFSVFSFTLNIRYLKTGLNATILRDTTQSVSMTWNLDAFSINDWIISPDNNMLLALTNSGSSFLINTILGENPSIEPTILNLTSIDAAFSPDNSIIYFINASSLIRYFIPGQTFDTINLNKAITSITPTYSGNLLLSYSGTNSNNLGIILNPNRKLVIGYRENYITTNTAAYLPPRPAYPVPVVDFDLRLLSAEDNTYELFLDSALFAGDSLRREPDMIVWYLNGSAFDTTTAGQNITKRTFYSVGNKYLTAETYFFTPVDTFVIPVHHFFYNTVNLIPDLIPDRYVETCDTPAYPVNFVKYAYGSDSVVWFLNNKKADYLRNVAYTTLRRPGQYRVYVYHPDTVLADTLDLRYLKKQFDRDDIQILINDQPYNTDENIVCTESGVVNFRIILPQDATCNPSYKVYWYFGDNTGQITLNRFISHIYPSPGTYTVTIQLMNNTTKGNYIFRFPVTVSKNPIDDGVAFVNLSRMEPAKITIGKDIKITDYNWIENYGFYINADTIIRDSATFAIPVTDTAYAKLKTPVRVFADLSTSNAQNLRITLKNSSGNQVVVQDFYTQPYDRNIFFGQPVFKYPYLPDWDIPESPYVYRWDDNVALNFEALLTQGSYDPEVFYPYDRYLQDNAMFDYQYFRLAPSMLKPSQPLSGFAQTEMGDTVYITVRTDTSVDSNSVTIGQIGVLAKTPVRTPSSYSFKWTTDANFLSYSDSSVTVGAALFGHYLLNLYVKDKAGCTYQHQIDLYVIDSLQNQIPNTFTPNGDGINDTWDLRRAFFNQLTARPPIPVYIKIWNKYGKVVKTLIVNNEPQWDGRDNTGRKLPPGVYWYVVIINNKTYTRGSVTIIY